MASASCCCGPPSAPTSCGATGSGHNGLTLFAYSSPTAYPGKGADHLICIQKPYPAGIWVGPYLHTAARLGGGGEAAAAVATEGMSVAGLSQRVRAERIRTGPGKGWD